MLSLKVPPGMEKELIAAVGRLARRRHGIRLDLPVGKWLLLLGCLQVALRQPDCDAEEADYVRSAIDVLIHNLGIEEPFLEQMLHTGFPRPSTSPQAGG